MSIAASQFSCFSSINRSLRIYTKTVPCLSLRTKVLVAMNHDADGKNVFNSETKTILSYTLYESKSQNGRLAKSYAAADDRSSGPGISEQSQEHAPQQQRAAKIHDFCFGIPFGGLILSGGLVGFIFSRNPTTLSNGVLFGGALLALSTISLKVWEQGKSSFPFILGQAVLAAAIFWKNFQIYSSTRKLFPTAFYAAISAAMICFYFYVVLSGGNPPPKTLRPSSGVPT